MPCWMTLCRVKSFVPEHHKAVRGARVPKKVGADNIENFLEIGDSQTDWEKELTREVIHDEITIAAERNNVSPFSK